MVFVVFHPEYGNSGMFNTFETILDKATSNTRASDSDPKEIVDLPDMVGIPGKEVEIAAGGKLNVNVAIAIIIVHGLIHNGGRAHGATSETREAGKETIFEEESQGVFKHRNKISDPQKESIRRQFPARNVPKDNRKSKSHSNKK